MKHLLKSTLLLLALLLPASATAEDFHDFEVDGIYYNRINDNSVEVTFKIRYFGEYPESDYTGDVIIPTRVTYDGISYSVIQIGWGAFRGCSGLTSVNIPNSVTSIGTEAFWGCSGLMSVTIPNSVTSISDNIFYGCSSLISIVVASDNATYDSRDNCNAIIITSSNTLIAGCKSTIIPNSVTTIGDESFQGCTGLTNVTIPNSVTFIGSWAFAWCSGLNDVYCYIVDPSAVIMNNYIFYVDGYHLYSDRTLHVPVGSLAAYLADSRWSDYFGTIVEGAMPGDVDLDCRVSIADVTELIDMLLRGDVGVADNPAADVNGNGIINIADVVELIDQLLY